MSESRLLPSRILIALCFLAAVRTISAQNPQILNLDRCLEIAWERNHRRPASQFAVAMAEAQHRQALAGYWPQVQFQAGYQRVDEPLNFVFPSSRVTVPPQTVQVPPGSALVTVPANAFGPGFPPSEVAMPVNFEGRSITTGAQSYTVPEQDIKLMNPDVVNGSVQAKWLIWDGGMRAGYRQQAGAAVAAMREAARRTDLEIADSIKRLYWGAVLARQLRQVGADTLERMEATLRLTESMYKEGAGKATRSDFLDNQVMVESLRAMLAQLEKNMALAQAALATSMGLSWTDSVQPADAEVAFQPQPEALPDLVATSYRFSPDWNSLEAAIKAAEGGVKTARSGYCPRIALTGELHRWWNGGYRQGIATPQNRAGWSAGVGLEIPLFDGFLTRGKVQEALARVEQLKANQFLLREGLGLQIKDLVLGLEAAAKACQATETAMKSARENEELNTRAYQEGLVETEKLIRAQLLHALLSAQHHKARFDHASLLSQLNLVVGTEVRRKAALP